MQREIALWTLLAKILQKVAKGVCSKVLGAPYSPWSNFCL